MMPRSMRSVVVLPAPFGPEKAEDGACGNGQADAVDGALFAEVLDQIDGFDRVLSGPAMRRCLSKHWNSLQKAAFGAYGAARG